MDQWEKNFCQNLRHLRKVHNLTQKEISEIIGVSVGTLSRIERCEENVRIHCVMLCRVCSHFQVSADEMVFENWPEMLARSCRGGYHPPKPNETEQNKPTLRLR